MSVGAILGSVLQSALTATNTPSKFKQFQQEFQQLGKDLQAGNLAQAQTDLVTLEQNSPYLHAGSAASTTTGNSASGNNNPIAQAFSQLAKDLQAGNVTAAQQDFSSIQQDFQNSQSQAPTQAGRHHHHHAFSSQSSTSPLAQLFSQLGQALQTGICRVRSRRIARCSRIFSSLQALAVRAPDPLTRQRSLVRSWGLLG